MSDASPLARADSSRARRGTARRGARRQLAEWPSAAKPILVYLRAMLAVVIILALLSLLVATDAD